MTHSLKCGTAFALCSTGSFGRGWVGDGVNETAAVSRFDGDGDGRCRKVGEKSLTAKEGGLTRTMKSSFSDLCIKYEDIRNVDRMAAVQASSVVASLFSVGCMCAWARAMPMLPV